MLDVLLLSFSYVVASYDVTIMGDNMYPQASQLELTCSSEGGPDLEYSWSRTNIFSATTTTNTNTLTISDLATVDGGDYTCTVTNDAGTSSATETVFSKLDEFFFKLGLKQLLQILKYKASVSFDFYISCLKFCIVGLSLANMHSLEGKIIK